MRVKIAFAASLVVSLINGSNQAMAKEEPTLLESRIAALEDKLRDFNAHLVQLDTIAAQLRRLSGDEVPQLPADKAKQTPTPDPDIVADSQSDRSVLQDSDEPPRSGADPIDGAAVDTREDDRFSPQDVDVAGPSPKSGQSGSQEKTGAIARDDQPSTAEMEQRVARMEQVTTAIDTRLALLDDIARAVDVLGRNAGDAASGRRALKPIAPSADTSSDSAQRPATLVINNWTGVAHSITINGENLQAEPGRNRFKTDFGIVNTRIGDKEMKWDRASWRKVGSEYELVLDLKY